MNEVNNSVNPQSSDHNPKIAFEADHRNQQKDCSNKRLKNHSPPARSHGCEQHVVGSDYDQQAWIKGPFAVKANTIGSAGNNRQVPIAAASVSPAPPVVSRSVPVLP